MSRKGKAPPIIVGRHADDTGKIHKMIDEAFERTDQKLDDLSDFVKQSRERFRERATNYAQQPRSKAILVVEDHGPSSDYFSTALRRAGYNTVTASNLAAAREAISSVEFGLIMLDMHLPNGDGWELAKIMPRTTSIVLTSALIEDDLQKIAVRVRADAVLSKPVSYRKLVDTVFAILGKP